MYTHKSETEYIQRLWVCRLPGQWKQPESHTRGGQGFEKTEGFSMCKGMLISVVVASVLK